jgi:hypothetical protein
VLFNCKIGNCKIGNYKIGNCKIGLKQLQNWFKTAAKLVQSSKQLSGLLTNLELKTAAKLVQSSKQLNKITVRASNCFVSIEQLQKLILTSAAGA